MLISFRFFARSGHIGSFRSIVGEGIRGEKFIGSPFPRRPALVHESDRGTRFSTAAPIGYFTANEFGLPSSNIRFRMLHAISASESWDSG